MEERLLVSTRKGLFQLERRSGRWSIGRVSFMGDAVTLAARDEHSRALYAGLGLGHYGVKLRKSTDEGETWDDIAAPSFPPAPQGESETFSDGRPWPWRVEQIWAFGPSASALWCGTIGGGLFRSTDGGASWELNRSLWDHPKRKEWFGGGADMPGIHSICVDPNDDARVLVGVSCGGAWSTDDAGATWTIASQGMFAEFMPPERREDPYIQDPHCIAQCRARPDRLWCQHHNGVFRSDDRGKRWTSIDNVKPAVFGFAVAAHPTDPDTAWLVPAQKDDRRVPVDARVVVSRTRDGGESWQELTKGLPQEHAYDLTYRHALDVDARGERLAFGSTTGGLWISEDGGDAWTAISEHLPPIYAVRFA